MYTLTQEQVKDLVKGKKIQEVLPEAFTIQHGKWYKDPAWPLRLVYVEKALLPMNNNDAIEGYGFTGAGNWHVYSNGFYAGSWYLYEATKEEVEAMLFAEAKKRGFVDGAKVICLDTGQEVELLGGKLFFYFKGNCIFSSGAEIFNNGQWATIVTETKEQILSELIDYATQSDNTYLYNQLNKLKG